MDGNARRKIVGCNNNTVDNITIWNGNMHCCVCWSCTSLSTCEAHQRWQSVHQCFRSRVMIIMMPSGASVHHVLSTCRPGTWCFDIVHTADTTAWCMCLQGETWCKCKYFPMMMPYCHSGSIRPGASCIIIDDVASWRIYMSSRAVYWLCAVRWFSVSLT